MRFNDRFQAGLALADKLSNFNLNSKNSVIAAIPRGGVVVAEAISQKLNIPIKAIVLKKLGAPHNSELALGAVSAFGKPVLDNWLIADLSVGKSYLRREINKKRREAIQREKFLNSQLNEKDFQNKTVIVVDDGLATGQTAKAAAKVLRGFRLSKVILAVGCASPATIDLVKDDFDEIICPVLDKNLQAVGQFYRDFSQVSDNQVKDILERTVKKSDNW